MTDDRHPTAARRDAVTFDPDSPCEKCGRFGAYRFSGHTLCEECYEGAGSCCPEFGQDDLWSQREKRRDGG